ncbi:MAG: tetraacyldisaccharide 4'-kinase [Deltaproteobacteria bacterium]|nr:MAG: tetraacyldisaccharide 4'-kinase [Deltaproteobacteria bacterium]
MGPFQLDWGSLQGRLSRFPFSMLLAFLSFLYGLGIKARAKAYSLGVLGQRSLRGFVLSVGNLTAGGTGKTPAVIMLAQWAQGQGYNVCVLTRGYGGAYGDEVLEVTDGAEVKVGWRECGDEAYLVARRLEGVPVIVARKRYLGGQYAAEKFGSNFFILDDGFQHLRLKRDFDLVLVDSLDPFGNGHLLPRGILREPVHEIKRCQAIVLTRWEQGAECKRSEFQMKKMFPQIPLFVAQHVVDKVVIPARDLVHEASYLSGKRVIGFAGIGKPEAFRHTLLSLGAEVIYFRKFKDHHRFQKEEIESLREKAITLKADLLITTEKDWVRLKDFGPDFLQAGYVSIRFSLGAQGPQLFSLINKRAIQVIEDLGEHEE